MVRVQPLDTATIDIWDIADPPVLEPYLFYPRSLPRLLHTIDPCRIFGLTFLMNAMEVFGLHCHTRDRPTVESAMELLGPTIPDDLSCLYVPLPPGERILAVDVRRGAWQDHTYCIQVISIPKSPQVRICRRLLNLGAYLTYLPFYRSVPCWQAIL